MSLVRTARQAARANNKSGDLPDIISRYRQDRTRTVRSDLARSKPAAIANTSRGEFAEHGKSSATEAQRVRV